MLNHYKLVVLITLNTRETDPFRQQMIDLLPRLRRFAYTLTSDRYEADDLVQAACERALSRRDQFREGTRMDSWMFRIIHTLRIDASRSLKFRTSHSSFDEKYDSGDAVKNEYNKIEARMLLENVKQAMARLSENDRAVLALVCVDGMSYREAADTLAVPVGTVMSRLARARIKLAKLVYGSKKSRHMPAENNGGANG